MSIVTKEARRLRRRRRVRAKVKGTSECPRLSVFRSNLGVTAQLVDDIAGKTLASAYWTEAEVKKLGRMEQAEKVGELIAKRAKENGINRVVFDRGGYQYHGRVKALAEGARQGGLEF